MRGKYVAPVYQARSYTCPRCDTLAPQSWQEIGVEGILTGSFAARCFSCQHVSIWETRPDAVTGKKWYLVYPNRSPAPPPNADLPPEVKKRYVEAADIVNRSPAGAAAMLRLGVQLLCIHFEQPGKDINADIGALVKAGLSPLVQEAMDTVRITGNESVHPGEINLEDDEELALSLFDFVNLIAEQMITTPQKVAAMYARMPEVKRDGVAQRDGAAP